MEVSHPKALPPFYWPIGEASQPSRYRRGCQAPRWGIERTFLVLQDDGPIIPVDPASGYPTRFVSTHRTCSLTRWSSRKVTGWSVVTLTDVEPMLKWSRSSRWSSSPSAP
jgi:hypothetical protein